MSMDLKKLQNENVVHMKPLDDAYIILLDHFLGSEICLSPFQVSGITCPVFTTDIKFKLKYFLVMLTAYQVPTIAQTYMKNYLLNVALQK